MRIYNMPRQSGKTTLLVNWLTLDPEHHVMLVHSSQEAVRIREEYPEVADQIVSLSYLEAGGLRGRRNLTVAIDNLDLILPALLGWPNRIGPITYTGDYSYGN